MQNNIDGQIIFIIVLGMVMKPRSTGQTAISVSLPEALLESIDERAGALGLNRSQYLAHLARAHLRERGQMTLHEDSNSPGQVAAKAVVAAAIADVKSGRAPTGPKPPVGKVRYQVPRRSKKQPPA